MVSGAVTQTIKDGHGKPVEVLGRLEQHRRNGADDHCFRHSSVAVARNVANDLASASRVADVNGVLEIKRFGEFGHVGSISVHVVAVDGLSGTAMSTAIMRDHT